MKLETSATPAIPFKDRADTNVVNILQRKEGLNLRAGREGSAEQSASLPPLKPQVPDDTAVGTRRVHVCGQGMGRRWIGIWEAK